MDITETIQDWVEEIDDLDMKDPSHWWQIECELTSSQYSYIKFGLLLTKIRNKCGWKYCGDKFASFKDWCLARIHLPIWQVNQYIEAAEIATYLRNFGARILPKNLSQCLALKKAYEAEEGYYGERPQLESAWEQVTNHYQPHQITAGKIHAIVDPEWADNQPSKIDKQLANRVWEQAKKRGMDINEYLQNLLDEDEEQEIYSEDYLADSDKQFQPNPEQQAIIDRVEYQWLKPQAAKKSIVETGNEIIDRMDDFFNAMLRPKPA